MTPDPASHRIAFSLVSSSLAFILAAFICGCGDSDRYGEILEEGRGPVNQQPLWPLDGLVLQAMPQSSHRDSWWWERAEVISQVETPEGRLVTVDQSALDSDSWWTTLASSTIWRSYADTAELLVRDNGDVVAVTPEGSRYLLVPAKVRVGMRWRVTIPAPRGYSDFGVCHPDASDGGEIHNGGGPWTFEVTQREERPTANGTAVVWTLSGTGPKPPYVDRNGRFDDGICATGSWGPGESGRVADMGPMTRVMTYVEGHGPLRHPLFATPETVPDTDAVDIPGGGSQPSKPTHLLDPRQLPVIPLRFIASERLTDYTGLDTGGYFLPRTARLTWSSTELGAGNAAELVLSGLTLVPWKLMNPNGGLFSEWVRGTVAHCFAVDPKGSELLPTDRLAGPCPDRLLGQDSWWFTAQPWVFPNGDWWSRFDPDRLWSRGGDLIDGSFTFQALQTQGPLLRDGVFHTLNCHGHRPEDPCELVAFPEVPPRYLSRTSNSGVIQGLSIWRHQESLVGSSAGGGEGLGPPRPWLRYALSHEDGFIHVMVGAGPPGSPWEYGVLPDQAYRTLVIRWFSVDGRLLDYRALPVWQPGLWHADGRYRLTDLRPHGELYEYDIGPHGVRVLVRGRVDLPEREHGEHALWLGDDRFLVVTSRPRGDGSRIGFWLPRILDETLLAGPTGVMPAIPDSLTKELRFYTTERMPPSPQVDPLPSAQSLHLWLTGSILTLCDRPSDDPPLIADVLEVGGNAFDLSNRPRDAAGCHQVQVRGSALAEARDQPQGRRFLPVAYRIRGLGLIRRAVLVELPDAPPIDQPDTGDAPPDRPSSRIPDLPTMDRRFPKSVRPTATNLYCAPALAGTALNPGPLVPDSLTSCGYYLWGQPTSAFPQGEIAHCDPRMQTCLDLLAYGGDPSLLDTHVWGSLDPDHPWVREHPELFPPGRLYWTPKERPIHTLALDDFANATPMDPLALHFRVVPAQDTWILPSADPLGPPGHWPATLGAPIVDPPSPFDPSPLIAGTGLDSLPEPVQQWEGHGLRLQVFGPPVARWLLRTSVHAGHRLGWRWTSGPLPSPAARVLAADPTLALWDDGTLMRLDSGTCVPQPELCNGQDDDCDGDVDENGASGCPDARGVFACVEGVCFRSGCVEGFASCDSNPLRCDVPLGTMDDCLGCRDSCPTHGGSRCEASGCTPVAVEEIAFSGAHRFIRYANGELYRSRHTGEEETLLGRVRRVAATEGYYCTLQDAGSDTGRLSCTCESGSWNDCSGVVETGPGDAPVDRVWVGGDNTCFRTAGTGTITCKGDLTQPAPFTPAEIQVLPEEFAGADQVAFSSVPPGLRGYALEGGRVRSFWFENGTLMQSAIEGLPPVLRLHGQTNYLVFETTAGVYGIGASGRYPALGGPPGYATTPVRWPGLDGFELLPWVNVPCRLEAGRIACPLEDGYASALPPQTSFDGAPTKRTDGWLELPATFTAAFTGGSSLCIVRPDRAATVVCQP